MRRIGEWLVGAAVVLAAAACSVDPPPRQSAEILAEALADVGQPEATHPRASRSLAALPASFAGIMPCAGCPGLHYRLNLHRDRTFFLRTTRVDDPAEVVDDIGRWRLEADRRTLTLRGSRAAAFAFAIVDDHTLRRIAPGRPAGLLGSHTLVRAERYEPFEPHVNVHGHYSYRADAGTFTDCVTGQKRNVAAGEAHAELQLAYAAARRVASHEVLVSVEGRIIVRPSGSTIVIDRFLNAWPGRTCGMRPVTATLDHTRWTLVQLGGRRVEVAELPLEPQLQFQPEDRQFTGSDGCNRLIGSYRQDGSQLTLSVGAVTREDCPEGGHTAGFSDALGRVRSWQITGQQLDLYDAEGRPVARLEVSR